jgi:methyl-accepting chemotaxis protein
MKALVPGNAGKGFAVVAEEVRNLAMRSSRAAKDTAGMIEESVRNAGSGVQINEEMLKNLGAINNQVVRMNEVMAGIAQASEQQSEGVIEIAAALKQINEVTQQTAANSEESASASEALSTQASEMRSMVESFNLLETGRSYVPRDEPRSASLECHFENSTPEYRKGKTMPAPVPVSIEAHKNSFAAEAY